MAQRIEDYALVGDLQTAALVGRDGSIDWLCLPRFDSGACFAGLLGGPENGHWSLVPAGEVRACRRRYRPGTLILETDYETDDGAVTLTDFMPIREGYPYLFRIVEGKRGTVRMRLELVIRFDYGSVVPWVQRANDGLTAIAGPDSLYLVTPVEVRGEDLTTVADFTVNAGQRVPFSLTWHPSHLPRPGAIGATDALDTTERWWRQWSARCKYAGPWKDAVVRSLITLKALTFAPTGGIVAAATTSLPEWIGGVRNWDYRYCWLRDATFSLLALLAGGYREEARAWRQWLMRATAGHPAEMQIMYGLGGERRLTEFEIPWLPGYQGSRPVRIGNAASQQFQLDVYGEVIDAMFQARREGLETSEYGWRIARLIFEFLEKKWQEPDEGIWEVRGPRRHFTHSKVMAWVAFDRAVKAIGHFGLDGPLERWTRLRDTMHAEICDKGFNAGLGSFVQSYGSKELDASLLMIPLVGFLPAEDSRVRGTVAAVEKRLLRDGFVARYDTGSAVDGLPPGEGAFLPCTFWLADNYALAGRVEEGQALFERLLGLANDVGLLAEEYDPHAKRLLGNFPQAFTHVGLVNSACNLHNALGPAEHRCR
jgi:GH15 family glucan-1,4-alpha-glucosidase